jgi:hypothetical protein
LNGQYEDGEASIQSTNLLSLLLHLPSLAP